LDNQYQKNIADLSELLRQPKNVLILSHKNPDGDAVGSSTGLLHFLLSRGHKADIVFPNDIPDFISWLPGCERITIYKHHQKKADDLIDSSELIFFLDFNSSSRIDSLYKKIKTKNIDRVMIDHHPYPENFANITFSDTSVSSTAELVYRIILDVCKKDCLSKESAIGLFVGIMTDTGCFSYNSSNPGTFQAVAHLLQKGIHKDEIYGKVYDNYSFERMRLLGHSLKDKMEFFPGYRTGIISLTRKELYQFDFNIGDTEGFVNYPLTIKRVVFSALFIEKKDMIKISFRSKGTFPVNTFAKKHFNGGGHLNAAGGESKESLAKVLNRFKSLLDEYRDELLKSS
jgi:bifunctional oligoribonuclease and PAP phosphatase NrnA